MNAAQLELMLKQLDRMADWSYEAEKNLYCMTEAYDSKMAFAYLDQCRLHCLRPDRTVLRRIINRDFKDSN